MRGTATVTRIELAKLVRQAKVRAALLLCVAAPLLAAAAISVQGSLPSDTLFGQWLHESGFALPLVVLGFSGQWVLPLLVALVAGDVFSAEDHHGTWKTVLTRSRTRGQMFTGKCLAAFLYVVAAVAALAAASLGAGLLLGVHPLVGLSGQLVPPGRATGLVLGSWASQLPPALGYAAVAVLLSVVSRSSLAGIGGPVVLGLLLQLSALVDLPQGVRTALLSTPFGAWHGFWVTDTYLGPLRHGLVTSAVWFVVCGTSAWLVFRRRSVRVS